MSDSRQFSGAREEYKCSRIYPLALLEEEKQEEHDEDDERTKRTRRTRTTRTTKTTNTDTNNNNKKKKWTAKRKLRPSTLIRQGSLRHTKNLTGA